METTLRSGKLPVGTPMERYCNAGGELAKEKQPIRAEILRSPRPSSAAVLLQGALDELVDVLHRQSVDRAEQASDPSRLAMDDTTNVAADPAREREKFVGVSVEGFRDSYDFGLRGRGEDVPLDRGEVARTDTHLPRELRDADFLFLSQFADRSTKLHH